MKKILLLLFMLLSMTTSHSQVLISLVFGDKLNTGSIEFGLEGGANFSTLSNVDDAKYNPGFNLGFYFDFLMKKHPGWMINTGVIVKSPLGANNLPVYSLNNAELDNIYQGGHVNREIRYFNVPILLKYQFKNHIFVKAGPEVALLANAFDEFIKEIDDDDLRYKNNIRDKIHVIDAGLCFGTGYRLMGGNGMNIGLTYYLGLVPVMKGDGPRIYNRSFYVTVGIPIGKGKAMKRAAEKKAETEKAGTLPEQP
ncbi:porin family protein [Flavobacterium hauense]